LAAGFCSKKLAFAQKMMVLPESGGGLQPSPWSQLLCYLWLAGTLSG